MKKVLWAVVAMMSVAAGALFVSGNAGYAFGLARTWLQPRDLGLLAYFPAKADALGVAQVALATPARSTRLRDDLRDHALRIEADTGVRPAQDVETVVFDAELAVARGRFDWGRMQKALERSGWSLEEKDGRRFARAGGQLLTVEGNHALLGKPAAVEAALARKADGSGLGAESPIVRELDALGWRQTFLGVFLVRDPGRKLSALFLGGAREDSPRRLGVTSNALFGGLRLQALGRGASEEEAHQAVQAATELRAALQRELDAEPSLSEVARALREARLERAGREAKGALHLSEQALEQLLDKGKAVFDVAARTDFTVGATPALQPPSATDAAPTPMAAPSQAEPDDDGWTANLLRARVNPLWRSIAWTAGLLALALLSVPRRGRPGYLNVALAPAFLLPAVVATTGLVFLGWLAPHVPETAREWVGGLALPLVDLDQLLGRPPSSGHPLLYSVLPALAVSPLAVKVSPLRKFGAGLALGFAGSLTAAAFAGLSLAYLPWAPVATGWLAVNAFVALFIGRSLLVADVAPSKR